MASPDPRDDNLHVVFYRLPKGLPAESFRITLRHLAGAVADLELIAERTRAGTWRPLFVRVLQEATHPDHPRVAPRSLMPDLATLVWHVFPSHQRGRVLHPVVQVWQSQGLTVAACLDDRYGLPHLPFAAQMAQLRGVSSPASRDICPWPDAHTWQAVHAVLRARRIPSDAAAVNWWPPEEWFRRPDIAETIDGTIRGGLRASQIHVPRAARDELRASLMTLAYSQYLRHTRTLCLYLRLHNLPFKVSHADFDTAMHHLRRQGLDPARSSSWATIARLLDEMPLVVLRQSVAHGRVVRATEPAAALAIYSHMPGVAPPDAVGAVLAIPGKPTIQLVAWLNPAADPVEAHNHATDLLIDACTQRGIQNVAQIEEVQPLEICYDCGTPVLHAPERWLQPFLSAALAQPHVGRNDPCPCGSGKKYKKCCGRAVH
jgi:hypothetical protein